MAASRTSFDKLQRDRAKKAKAAAKRAKRLERNAERPAEEESEALDPSALSPGQEIPPDQLLKMVEDLHRQFESNEITFEEFEERKTELFALISVD